MIWDIYIFDWVLGVLCMLLGMCIQGIRLAQMKYEMELLKLEYQRLENAYYDLLQETRR